ncbi:MAG TPA: MmcQ/YjbR family DNA-binding protein [Steroidobacteraceae bacterium]|nr:MmcQ/YjbR family DNA-binding protein [Steroidobacteraceae bacterium]
MANELEDALGRLGLAFPATEAFRSHGMLNFRVRGGKTFLTYAQNHHGDGRLALWLNVPQGMQDACVRESPEQYFVPPYVGPRGWLGVRLDRGLAWQRVSALVRAAYMRVAPARLSEGLGKIAAAAPKRRFTVADFDPKESPTGKRVLAAMRTACLALPQSAEAAQFGWPVWRVGKRVFAQVYCREQGWRAAFWVGVASQALLAGDRRFAIPHYLGHLGWIALDVSGRVSARELRALAVESYRHFAPKRLLAQV